MQVDFADADAEAAVRSKTLGLVFRRQIVQGETKGLEQAGASLSVRANASAQCFHESFKFLRCCVKWRSEDCLIFDQRR